MSRFLGEVRQNGYVVRDIEGAMKRWTEELGIGPFLYLEDAALTDFRYRGKRSRARASLGFAHVGRLQIELIQPLDDEPSMYADFLRAGHEGLQHLGCLRDDYEESLDRCLERGWVLGQSGSIEGVRFAYFDTEIHPGTVIELIEGGEVSRGFYAMLEERCRDWDGSDPIRRP